MSTRTSVLLFGILFVASSAVAEDPSPRMLSLNPIGEHACVSVPLSHGTDEVLSGLRWLHNDDTLNFPRLLLLERTGGEPPNLAEVGLVLYELGGEELGWGQADLGLPVTSSTGLIWAVFVFPANTQSTGLGQGGGPGIGLREVTEEDPFYLSADGLSWVRFDPTYALEVETVLGAAQKSSAAVRLGELASQLDYFSQVENELAAKPVTQTRLLPAHPNPFNPRTVIGFELDRAGPVTVDVYDVRGRHVVSLTDRSYPAGRYRTVWEGVDAHGRAVASGVYLVLLEAAGHRQQRKVVLVR